MRRKHTVRQPIPTAVRGTVSGGIILALVSAVPPQGHSQERYSRRGVSVDPGTTVAEVLTRLGPPLEKQELETRRSEIWSYPHSEVRFDGGVVATQRMKGRFAGEEGGKLSEGMFPPMPAGAERPAPPPLSAKALFEEVMKEGGGSDDAPESPPSPGSQPPGFPPPGNFGP